MTAFSSIKKSRVIAKTTVTLMFVAFLLTPLFLMGKPSLFLPGFHENRKLAAFPETPKNVTQIKEYCRKIDNYVSDNFGLRALFISLNSFLKFKIFATSPTEEVFVGANGWLYKRFNIRDFMGLNSIGNRELRQWRIILEERRDWLAKRGIELLLVVAPAKQSVYPEFLPGYMVKKPQNTKTDQFLAYMRDRSDLKIVDLRRPLIEGKKEFPVFYKTDHHWNYRGAFIGYQKIAEALPRYFRRDDVLHINDMTVEPSYLKTNLYNMMGLTDGETVDFLAPARGWLSKRLKPDTPVLKKINQKAYATVTEINNPALPKAVFLGDSFMGWNSRFVAEHFRRVVFTNLWIAKSHWEHFPVELIRQEKPDVVVMQIVEGRLGHGKAAAFLAKPGEITNKQEVRQARLRKLFAASSASSYHPVFRPQNNGCAITCPDSEKDRKTLWITRLILKNNAPAKIFLASENKKAFPPRLLETHEVKLAKAGKHEIFICVACGQFQKQQLLKIEGGWTEILSVELRRHADADE